MSATAASDWRPAIRALLYCVQFEDDPTGAIDHALQTVVDKRALGLEPSGYREAIASALAAPGSFFGPR